MIYMELLVVLAAIFVGARVGGIGLGIFGMLGLGILVFGFGLPPGKAPIDVMLIIVAVIPLPLPYKQQVDWITWSR